MMTNLLVNLLVIPSSNHLVILSNLLVKHHLVNLLVILSNLLVKLLVIFLNIGGTPVENHQEDFLVVVKSPGESPGESLKPPGGTHGDLPITG